MDLGISKFFQDVADHWGAYVLALSILGSVTMAILQTIKDLFPVRQAFQRYRLKIWMQEGADKARVSYPAVNVNTAESDLLTLAVDGDEKAFYDLQIEQLCGQYTAAVQVILEFPAAHQDLLWITASEAAPADVALLVAGPPAAPAPMQPFLDARNRVTHQCQRAIDAFQIVVGFRWKWWLQIASLVIGVVLAWVAIGSGFTPITLHPFSVFLSALLAGFLAPVSKDLLAIVQRARGQ